jgi:hypothetical protein
MQPDHDSLWRYLVPLLPHKQPLNEVWGMISHRGTSRIAATGWMHRLEPGYREQQKNSQLWCQNAFSVCCQRYRNQALLRPHILRCDVN